MGKELRILILEDVAADAELMEMELRRAGIVFTSKRAQTREDFIKELDSDIDAVLADYALPRFNAMEAFQLLRERKADIPFILVTGSQGEEVAVECIKKGMDDYILKASLKRLPTAILKTIEKKESERTQKRLLSILDLTSDFVGIVDRDGYPLYLNCAWRRMAGIGEEGGGTELSIFNGHTERRRAQVMNEALQAAVREGIWSGETVMPGKNGSEIPVSQVIIAHKGQDRNVEFFSTIARDITERNRAEETIKHMAYHDPLTGLPNRLLLKDRLCQALARGREGKAAVLYLDMDRFKDINDTIGHPMGDELLKAAAERLENCLREGDTVARQGGDEFTILLPLIDRIDDVMSVIERVLSAFKPPFAIEGQPEFFLTVSMGISIYPDDGEDAETLLKNSDIALYQAKEAGRNTCKFFSKFMNEKIAKRLDFENRLRRALEREEFLLYYQPQIEIATGKVTGMEALLRWQEPEKGLVLPNEFISVVEDTGVIIPLGDWILRTACMQNKAWLDKGLKSVHVAVNISMRQFKQKNFVEKVAGILEQTRLGPEHLELELTESLLMEDVGSVIAMLRKLKSMGIKLSIDDFGTGYSSLAYLKKMPIDVLKIAQPFVHNIAVHSDDIAIATTIIRMGHSLNFEIVAEGVETVEQLELLKRMHCDKIQGFLVSRPLPPEKAVDFLENDSSLF